jgi:hypothetical protein
MTGVASISTIDVDGDLDMGAYDLKTDDIIESTSNHGVDVEGVNMENNKLTTVDAIGESVISKSVSDNLRNSHDAEVDTSTTGASYVKVKTMTFTDGIKGTLRVKFALKKAGGYTGYGRVYKNGVAIGAAKTGTDAWETESEDIDVGTIAPGETLELWGKAEHANAHVYLKEFRTYYDAVGGAAAMVTS